MRTINYGDTLIGQTLSLDFSSLTYNGNLKTTVIAQSKNGSMIKCNTDSDIDYITIQDGSNSTVLYKRIKDASAAEVSLTEYECNSFDDIVYLNTDAFGYSCIKINESANHKPLRINIDETNVYTGKSITATTCKGVGKVRKLTGFTKQKTINGINLLNITSTSKTYTEGITVTVNNDKSITIDGTNTSSNTLYFRLADDYTLPAGNYTLSNKNSNVSNDSFIFYDNNNFPRKNISNATFTEEVTIKPYIKILYGATVNNQTIYPMIVKGTYTAENFPDYEPYTGGIASPNSDYPQEIINGADDINIFNKSAAMYSDGIVKEELETGVRIKQTVAGTYKYGWIEIGKSELLGKTITIQTKKICSAENKPGIAFYYGNESLATHTATSWSLESLSTLTFTLPSTYPDECDRLFLILYSNTNGTGNAGDFVDYTDLKIAVKDKPTPYSSYGKGSIDIKSQNTDNTSLEELMKLSSGYQKIDDGYIFSTNHAMFSDGMTLDTPITLPASMSYTIKNGTGTNFRFRFVYDDGSAKSFTDYVSGTEVDTTKNIVINNITKSGASKIVKICIDYSTAGTFTLTNFMINEGTTVKPYVKHQESHKVLEFNKPLYQNCYLAEDGIHYTKKQIQLDGITYGLRVESVTLSNTNNLYYCVIEIPKYPGVIGINNMYSTHFTPYFGVKLGSCYVTNYGKYIVIVLNDQTLKTADAVNMWLNGLYANKTPVTIEYELATEIIEPYTDTPPIFIDQFENKTTVSTSDDSEIEVEMTSNESLANIQKEIKNLYDKSKVYNSDTPIGAITEWSSNTAPDGWLLCDGSAVSRTNYSELFNVIGTFFGSGDGSTTFNLPNRQGRFGYGATSTNESDDYSLGKTGRRSDSYSNSSRDA